MQIQAKRPLKSANNFFFFLIKRIIRQTHNSMPNKTHKNHRLQKQNSAANLIALYFHIKL